MKILLTNDDGIESPGIQTLAKKLREHGHKVSVIAPLLNRSGISHAISIINDPVKLSVHGEDAWACTGFPADCVLVGTLGKFIEKPDLVLSGINKGANIGTDIVYSGTAAGARQASITGLPGIALSLHGNSPYNWDMAASWSAGHLEELLSYWAPDTFVNVNIPNNPSGPSGIAVTHPAIKDYNDVISVVNAPDGNFWCFLTPGKETTKPAVSKEPAGSSEPDSDWNTVFRNFVSVSPIHSYAVLSKRVGA